MCSGAKISANRLWQVSVFQVATLFARNEYTHFSRFSSNVITRMFVLNCDHRNILNCEGRPYTKLTRRTKVCRRIISATDSWTPWLYFMYGPRKADRQTASLTRMRSEKCSSRTLQPHSWNPLEKLDVLPQYRLSFVAERLLL